MAETPNPTTEPQGPDQAAPATDEPKPVRKPLTPFQRFLRAALRWTALVVGVFALGLLSGYILLYQPAQRQNAQLKASLTTANQKAGTTDQLKSENEQLTQQVNLANGHILLLQALNDANSARLGLANKDTASARKVLTPTSATLDRLVSALGPDQQQTAKAAQARLSLVLTELSSDPTTAASDLAILSKQLVDLEQKAYPSAAQ